MSDTVRNILARFGLDYDSSNFKKLLDDTMQGIKELKKLGVSFQAVNKAQQQLNTKQLATESKQLTIENKKAALANKEVIGELKRASIADKQAATRKKEAATVTQKLASESKKLVIALKQLKLEQQQARGERYKKGLEAQDRAANDLSKSLGNLRDNLVGVGVLAGAGFLFNIALKTERAVLRIQNLIDKTALAKLEKRFDTLNKQNRELFSKKDFKESAAAVLLIDRNVGFFAKSLEFAIKKAPVLGKSLKEIQEGLAEARVLGDEQALIGLGLITPLALEEMRRRTGISFGDLRPEERTNMILNLMKLTTKQLKEADAATRGLNASWNRFNKLIEDGGERLTEDFKPTMIFLLEGTVKFLRLLASSPIGLFSLRLGGLIAGVATLTLGLGVLSKAVIFLRLASLKAHTATLRLFGKFLFFGVLIAAVIILIDDLWVSLAGPEDADTLLNRMDKFIKDIQTKIKAWLREIGLGWLVDFNAWLDKTLENITLKIIDFFKKLPGRIVKLPAFLRKNLKLSLLPPFLDPKFNTTSPNRQQPVPNSFEDWLRTFGEKMKLSLLPPFLNPRFNTTSPNRQLSGTTSSVSSVDNSTSLTFGNNSISLQSGANKQDILNAAVDQYKIFLEQQLNEAQIGGR